jgi:hypothetical protein
MNSCLRHNGHNNRPLVSGKGTLADSMVEMDMILAEFKTVLQYGNERTKRVWRD